MPLGQIFSSRVSLASLAGPHLPVVTFPGSGIKVSMDPEVKEAIPKSGFARGKMAVNTLR